MLIGLFAVLAVGVLSYGVAVYRHLTGFSEDTYFQRTSLSYFANQIRTFDEAGSVTLGKFQDVDAIILRETVENDTYLTYLYYYDGAIRQLATQEGNQLTLNDGESLLPAEGMDLSLADSSLSITVEDTAGASYRLTVTPRCGATEVVTP